MAAYILKISIVHVDPTVDERSVSILFSAKDEESLKKSIASYVKEYQEYCGADEQTVTRTTLFTL